MPAPKLTPRPGAPADQADGLRRMFGGASRVFVPVVGNPHVGFASVLLERISTTFALAGVPLLLVDAADDSPAPGDLALLDLAGCVERLDERTFYLAGRGLPRAFVDSRGSAARLLPALAASVPTAQVVLVHGEAADLARIFNRADARPLVLAADRVDAVKHAYAACKVLAQRAGLMTFDLVLSAPQGSRRARAVAASLAGCLDNFLGAMLHDWVLVDPAIDVGEPPSAELRQLLARQLQLGQPLPAPPPGRSTPVSLAWRTTTT